MFIWEYIWVDSSSWGLYIAGGEWIGTNLCGVWLSSTNTPDMFVELFLNARYWAGLMICHCPVLWPGEETDNKRTYNSTYCMLEEELLWRNQSRIQRRTWVGGVVFDLRHRLSREEPWRPAGREHLRTLDRVPLEYYAEYQPVHACKKIIWSWKNNYLKGLQK